MSRTPNEQRFAKALEILIYLAIVGSIVVILRHEPTRPATPTNFTVE